MGWKNVKEHYKIEHQVQVAQQGICIGSSYIRNIIVVGLDGVIKKRYEDRGNDELVRYQREMDADPSMLRQLIKSPDIFSASIPVYTYSDGDVIEKQCEIPGWPNVTHDGEMMYENTFSTDKAEVVGWAKANAICSIEFAKESVADAEKTLTECRERLTRKEAALAKLENER